MNTRERFHAIMNFEPFDRLPLLEWAAWWELTLDRWRGDGLSADLQDRYAIARYFGQDIYKQYGVRAQTADCPTPIQHGAPLIANEKDYDEFRKYLYPNPAIDPAFLRQCAEEQQRGEIVLWITLDGFFWFPRILLGIEPHLYAFYEQPELMHRINGDLKEYLLRVLDEIGSVCAPDFLTFAEDMSYNHGPMLSRDLFDEFLKPHYLEVLPRIKALGTIPFIDSDGDIATPLHWFEETGLRGILPLERQSGVDIASLRAAHPKMRFIGHFDKMVMHQGEKALRAEFERLLPTAARGGFLPSCDHQTPPGVSLQDYQLYMALFAEYAQEAGRLSRQLPPHPPQHTRIFP